MLADYLFHQNLIQNFAAGPAAPVGTEHSFRLAVPVPARAETGEVLNITYRTVAMRRWKATNAHPTISLGSMTFLPRCGIDGYVRALDGWTYFVDDSVRSMLGLRLLFICWYLFIAAGRHTWDLVVMLTFGLMPIASLPCHVRPLVCDCLAGEGLLDEMNCTVVV